MIIKAKVLDYNGFNKESVEKAVKDFNEKYSNSDAVGELNPDPNDGPRISHTINKLWLEDDGVYSEIELLDTPHGRQVELILDRILDDSLSKKLTLVIVAAIDLFLRGM